MAQKLFDKSSLVMIPSQYKEGKIYNIKPEDQSSSFEFERGSAATRVNSDGLIEYVGVGEELVTNGDFSDDSSFPSNGWTISSGSPVISNGKLTLPNNARVRQIDVVDTTEEYIGSIEISGLTQGYVDFYIGNTEKVSLDSNGTHSFFVSDPTSAVIYLYAFNNFDGEIDNVSVKKVSNDTPRLDYSGTEPSLLLEPQRTNLVTHSINFNTYLTNSVDAIMTPNYGIAPDGTTTSTRFQWLDSTAFSYRAYNISTEHTASVYVKGTLGETVMFGFGGNVTTGNVYAFTGDWQRITFNGSSATQFFLSNYGGSTATEFEAWGLQLEQGSYATSYIFTNGLAETRLKDNIVEKADVGVTGEDFTILFDFDLNNTVLSSNVRVLDLKDSSGTAQQEIRFFQFGGEHTFVPYFREDSTYAFGTGDNDMRFDGRVIFRADGGGSYSMFFGFNGVSTKKVATGLTPYVLNKISFVEEVVTIGLKGLTIFNTALSDNECINLTTI